MIYLFIFIYLLFLSIHYDILENKKYKWTHFKIVITLLILLAGLRWRVGSDTVVYASDFYFSHDLFHLELSDFDSVNKMPFWVILNAFCKTIWDDFLLVQFIVAVFSLSVSGYFIKKICPSFCFFVLFCYFISRFTALQMEVMRESIAVSFCLLGILYFNEKKYKNALVFSVFSVMSHVFAVVAILVFIVCYYCLPKNIIFRMFLCFILLLIVLLENDIIIYLIVNSIGGYFFNEEIVLRILGYTNSDMYGNAEKSALNYISLILYIVSYSIMLYKVRGKYLNSNINLNKKIFDVCVFICMYLLCIRFSFAIVYRIGLNYYYYFTCILSVAFLKVVLLNRINKKQRILFFCFFIIVPICLSYRSYFTLNLESGAEILQYKKYYPYSSVFDRNFDKERERLYQIRGEGFSRYNDY